MQPTEVRINDLNGYPVEWDSIKSLTIGVIRENLEAIKRTLLKSGTEIKRDTPLLDQISMTYANVTEEWILTAYNENKDDCFQALSLGYDFGKA